MAEAEEPQFLTLAERIAELNKQKNFQAPSSASSNRPGPAFSTNRPVLQKDDAVPTPRPQPSTRTQPLPVTTISPAEESRPPLPRRPISTQSEVENAPPLPSRPGGSSPGGVSSPTVSLGPATPQQSSPALPPRRTSIQTLPPPPINASRRSSTASVRSTTSTASALSLNLTKTPSASSTSSATGRPLRKLPPALDQATLPPLPPTRRELEARALEAVEKEAAGAARNRLSQIKSAPAVPRLGDATAARAAAGLVSQRRLPLRTVEPQPMEENEGPAPMLPRRPLALTMGDGAGAGRDEEGTAAPPPLPSVARPNLAQINAAVAVAGSGLSVPGQSGSALGRSTSWAR